MRLRNINHTYYIKDEDTATKIRLQVLDYENQPFDLKSAEKVEVIIGINEGRLLTKEPDLLDETGVLEFRIDEDDVLVVGKNFVEVHITTNDGRLQKAPSKGYYELILSRSIDTLGANVTKVTLQHFLDEVERTKQDLTDEVENAIGYVDAKISQMQSDVQDAVQYTSETVNQVKQEFNEQLDTTVDNKMTPFVDEVRAQLADKATKTEVTSAVAPKADITYVDRELSRKADTSYVDAKTQGVSLAYKESYATLADLQTAYPTGDTFNHVVLADGMIYTYVNGTWTNTQIQANGTGIADNTVTEEKTTFLNKTHNLIDLRDISRGIQLNPDTGAEVEHASYSTTGFIDVKPNTDYYINVTHSFHRYDKDGNWISGTTNATGVRNTGAAAKVRLSILNGQLYNALMNEGTSALPFVHSGYDTKIGDTQKEKERIAIQQKPLIDSLVESPDVPFSVIDILNDASSKTVNLNRGTIIDEFGIRYKNRRQSYRIDTVGTSPITIEMTLASPLDLVGISEFISIVYIEDVTKLDLLVVSVDGTAWSRQSVGDLKNGWNILRYQVTAGDTTTWNQTTKIRFSLYYNAKTTIYLSDLLAIRPDKGKILFVNDHGYHNFKEVAYPQLKALGIPVTWAINPGRLGMKISATESILTQADIDELAYDPYSEFSMHAWNPTERSTANMTADELLEDTHKCMTYLRRNGILPKHPWRAAFVQNLAPNHEVLQPYLEAYASPVADASFELYPFRNPYNVNRVAVHARDNAFFDSIFDRLRKSRALLVCYTHGLDDAGGIHMTSAQFDYFLSKVEAGVTEGWLEGTTYSKLRGQYQFRDYKEVL